MLLHYLKITFRYIRKNKAYSFINIAGLSLGIACSILLFMYALDEISYDSQYPGSDRIYRVVEEISSASGVRAYAPIAYPVGPALAEKYPQIESETRVDRYSSLLVTYGEKRFYEDRVRITDDNFHKIFNTRFLIGNPANALSKPGTIIITEHIARKYFGNEVPIGKILKLNATQFEVTGVIENCPSNTHLKYDFFVSLSTFKDRRWMQNWYGTECYTYIKLKPSVNVEQFKNEMKNIIHDYIGDDLDAWSETRYCLLQPVEDIHLKSACLYEPEPPGSYSTVLLLLVLGLLVLVVACMNFINLTTAKSFTRAKEIGLRKVIGSDRKQLVIQFFGETFILTFVSMMLALVIIEISLPAFNQISGKSFDLFSILHTQVVFAIIVTGVLVVLLSGIYPSLFLSSFKPALTLKGQYISGLKGSFARSVMVVFQFAISILLITSTAVIYSQISYMKNRYPGFNKEQKIVIPFKGGASLRNGNDFLYESVKNEFKENHSVLRAAASSSVPGITMSNYSIQRVGKVKETGQGMYHLFIDHDFIKEYEIEMAAGRNFNYGMKTDISLNGKVGGFLLNEAAAKALGFKNPEAAVGEDLKTGNGGRIGRVIGVTKDFNYFGFKSKVDPLVMEYLPNDFRYITLTVNMKSANDVLAFLKTKWHSRYPNVPFEYFFLDKEFAAQYKAEERLGEISSVFTFLAIFIACLGLLGLVSFSAARRTKEIGIRKVLGASVSRLVFLLSKDLLGKVLLANVIAWPVAYIILDHWLENFAYRINMSFLTFFLAGLITAVISLLTVSYQSAKAAMANPVESIKYE